jgi:hypothetical protein
MSDELCQHCFEGLVAHHHRNLRCPGERKTIYKALPEPVYWNPYNKVVQDHRDGTIYDAATNAARAKRGLPVPWTSEMGTKEVREPAVP